MKISITFVVQFIVLYGLLAKWDWLFSHLVIGSLVVTLILVAVERLLAVGWARMRKGQ
jgi:hypothetical protein